jgi:uncharacterized phiE125 gp8 family phage protein
MSDTISLITVARARQVPQLAAVDATIVETLILAASKAIERYCNRLFVSQSLIEVYDGNGETEIMLRHYPLITLTSVVILNDDESITTIAITEFRTDSATGHVWFKPNATAAYTYFPSGRGNITITYTSGFAIIPADVQQACAQWAAELYTSQKHESTLVSERIGDYQAQYAQLSAVELPAYIRALLSTYREFRI